VKQKHLGTKKVIQNCSDLNSGKHSEIVRVIEMDFVMDSDLEKQKHLVRVKARLRH
jgi:hypothetical protein